MVTSIWIASNLLIIIKNFEKTMIFLIFLKLIYSFLIIRKIEFKNLGFGVWEKTDEGLWIRGLDEAGQPEEAETPIVKEPTNKRFLRGLSLSSFRNNPKN